MITADGTSKSVDLSECPREPGKCRCEMCRYCGSRKHMSVHGPFYGKNAGSEPYSHEFQTGNKSSPKYRAEFVKSSLAQGRRLADAAGKD